VEVQSSTNREHLKLWQSTEGADVLHGPNKQTASFDLVLKITDLMMLSGLLTLLGLIGTLQIGFVFCICCRYNNLGQHLMQPKGAMHG